MGAAGANAGRPAAGAGRLADGVIGRPAVGPASGFAPAVGAPGAPGPRGRKPPAVGAGEPAVGAGKPPAIGEAAGFFGAALLGGGKDEARAPPAVGRMAAGASGDPKGAVVVRDGSERAMSGRGPSAGGAGARGASAGGAGARGASAGGGGGRDTATARGASTGGGGGRGASTGGGGGRGASAGGGGGAEPRRDLSSAAVRASISARSSSPASAAESEARLIQRMASACSPRAHMACPVDRAQDTSSGSEASAWGKFAASLMREQNIRVCAAPLAVPRL